MVGEYSKYGSTEAGGKGSLPLMIGVVAALGKRLLIVYDVDSHLDGTTAARHNKNLNGKIKSACEYAGAMVHTFDPYFEEVVGIEGTSKKNKDRKMREHLSGLASWDDAPEPLKELLGLVARRSGAEK